MGRRARGKGEKGEQFPVSCPPGGGERAKALAEKIAGGNRSEMAWRAIEALQEGADSGLDLETMLDAIRSGKPANAETQRLAKIGRGVLKMLEKETQEGK